MRHGLTGSLGKPGNQTRLTGCEVSRLDERSRRLVLASTSPRRRELLADAGYEFEIVYPSEKAECGICSQETPPELVARLAYQKAREVALRTEMGVIIGCDTVVECCGQILGKPKDRHHASQMLRLLRDGVHRVYSGLCLWCRPDDKTLVDVDLTSLRMKNLSDVQLEKYLESGEWEGKAGGFGWQDRHGWLQIVSGSESNVVGLPLELLQVMLAQL